MGDIIRGNFVVEACRDRYTLVTLPQAHNWAPFSTKGMEDYFFDLIEECGVDIDKSPSEIVDGALINGEWGKASSWGYSYEEAKAKYEEGKLMYFEDNTHDENDPYIVLHFGF